MESHPLRLQLRVIAGSKEFRPERAFFDPGVKNRWVLVLLIGLILLALVASAYVRVWLLDRPRRPSVPRRGR